MMKVKVVLCSCDSRLLNLLFWYFQPNGSETQFLVVFETVFERGLEFFWLKASNICHCDALVAI